MGANISSSSSGRAGASRFKRYTPMSEINVTPFVDVMLVLLIIFMVAAPLLSVGVEVDMPDTAATQLSGQDEPLVITIAADKRIFLQESEVALEEVVPRLNAITTRNKDLRIFLRADESIDYGTFMQLMATLNVAGFNKVGLETDPITK